MTETPPRKAARLSRIARWRRRLQARMRLTCATVVGIVVMFALPGDLGPSLRAVISWDTGILLFLALILIMMVQATPETMRWRAGLEDESRWVFLAIMAGAAFFSMFAVLGVLHQARGAGGHVTVELALLAAATILLSWLFAHTIFAVHYAHEYFGDFSQKRAPGLDFPGNDDTPDYWDFLYFSFVVGMTCQVSDVQVITSRWRRLVLAHGLVSFLYNTIVLALSINLLAGLL
jgi:uncharacterized membrane protein